MNLKDFVAETLTEIQLGVQTAIDSAKKNNLNGAINPVWGTPRDVHRVNIQNVLFDIAVTVSDKTTGTGEAGIKVVGIKVGGSGSGSTETSNISRIQFSIPIIPPVTTITDATG